MDSPLAASPERIVIAGDWHGDREWSVGVVESLPDLLPHESPRVIVHVGDFGVWPGEYGAIFLSRLAQALSRVDAVVVFVDGNHECFDQLHRRRRTHTREDGLVDIADNRILWAPRGLRWTWHARAWVACGGAVSVDRALRRRGVSWWSEEEITEADHHRIVESGPADVMVCHDAPMSVPMSFGPWPRGWDIADKARADAHRDRLQAITDELRPTHLFHGHYHRAHDLTVPMGHGDVRVVGLDQNGALAGNYRVLNVRSMEFELTAMVAS